jgi:hypothetical protein
MDMENWMKMSNGDESIPNHTKIHDEWDADMIANNRDQEEETVPQVQLPWH